MLSTTINAVKSILQADPSLEPDARARVMAAIRNSGAPAQPAKDAGVRLMKRGEVAARLGVTTRSVDTLAASGALRRIRLPGRVRGIGFKVSDVEALLN